MQLPGFLQRRMEAAANVLLLAGTPGGVDFSAPPGEPALSSPQSVSWRIFKNPVALFMGGVAAVILELAEPRVRAGVWEHSTFRHHPLARLRRTGLAAMVTVYGARSVSVPMISRVVQMHSRVAGETAAGARYSANDPALITWVHLTAAFGFAQAYHRFVEPLDAREFDALYLEGVPAARLYGSPQPPASSAEVRRAFDAMQPSLEPSPVIFRFLELMRRTPAVPAPLFWLQRLLLRGAVELVPPAVRARLGLTEQYGLSRFEASIVACAGAAADRIALLESPAAQSCRRVGLPIDVLYRGGWTAAAANAASR